VIILALEFCLEKLLICFAKAKIYLPNVTDLWIWLMTFVKALPVFKQKVLVGHIEDAVTYYNMPWFSILCMSC